MKHETDSWIGAAAALTLYQCVVVQKDLSPKAKLWIYSRDLWS